MKKLGKGISILFIVLVAVVGLCFGLSHVKAETNAVGDGVYVAGGATYTMDGGKITNRNNGVYITGNSTFNMTAGTISGNNRGVYLDSGTFNYSGGTISDEIYLASGTYITLKAAPSSAFTIRTASTASGTRIAKLDGISTVTLSLLNVSNLPAGSELVIESGYVVIKVKTFTVTIVSSNSSYGSVSQSQITGVPYGTAITSSNSSRTVTINGTTVTATPASSSSTASTTYTYSFSSWSYDGTTVTKDMTITANFSRSTLTRYYTVTFEVNNSSYGSVSSSSISVPYNSSISTSSNTITIGSQTVTATPASSWSSSSTEYSYSFSSWSKTSGSITSDTTITANFTQSTSTRRYKITFEPGSNGEKLDGKDGTNYDYEYYGTTISLSSSKVTLSNGWWIQVGGKTTSSYIYTFSGWSTSSSGSTISSYKVTGDVTFYAKYTSTSNKITVSFEPNYSSYGSVSKSSIEVSYGASISVSSNKITIGGQSVTATPASSSTQYTYSFSSWSKTSGTITSAITIKANFSRSTRNYTVTISAGTGGSVSKSSVSVPYGTLYSTSSNVLTIGSTDITATANSGYSFSSWSSTSGTITGTKTITASFSKNPIYYTITLKINLVSSGTSTAFFYETSRGQQITSLEAKSGSKITFNSGNTISFSDATYSMIGFTISDYSSYFFMNYEIGSTEYGAGKTYTVNGNITITAVLGINIALSLSERIEVDAVNFCEIVIIQPPRVNAINQGYSYDALVPISDYSVIFKRDRHMV